MSISNWLENYILYKQEFAWLSDKKEVFLSTLLDKMEDICLEEIPVLILTDNKREWFGEYIVENINTQSKQRPFLPFHNINKLFKNKVKDEYTTDLVSDMLDSSYNKYILFYIGKIESLEARFALKQHNSILWLLGKNIKDSFTLDDQDKFLDIKLISILLILDELINAYMFGEND